MEKKKNITRSKLCAVVTLTCFFIANVCGQFAYASVDFNGAAEVIKSSDSFIPFSSGKISYAKNFNSKDVIINIQDLHCHGETQRNIAAILKNFEKYGFDKIYLEGAIENVSTQNFISLRETDLGKLVIEDLVDNGTLSGAEYYSIKTGKADIIKPLDKSDLYFENLLLLGSILENQDLMHSEIKGLKSGVETVKKEYYNSDLLRLNKFNKEFLKGKISAKKYYSVLNKLANKSDINVGAYTNIEKYINLINEKGIDYSKVSDELKLFVEILKQNIPYGIYNELSQKSNEFADVHDLMPVFTSLSDKYGICARYKLKYLDTFFKHIKTNEELNLLGFVSEEDRLIYDIGISLATTKYEREVVFLDRFVKVLEGFFTAKISAGDYRYYLDNYARFQEVAARYLGTENSHLAYLSESLPLVEKYHNNNIQRDNVFISFLPFSNEPLHQENVGGNDFSEMKDLMDAAKNGAEIKIVITGGFHSEGLKNRLLENRTSFIIITPNITGDIESAENTYHAAISEYYGVFTSAINKMPASSEPLQIALPRIIASTINRARINQIPLTEVQELINGVFESAGSKKSIALTESLYEPVESAEVLIDSVRGDAVKFTVIYDYGYGKQSAYYMYDFKTKNVSLTVDEDKVRKMHDSFYYAGSEGYSAPNLFVEYGETGAGAVSELFKELAASVDQTALSLMDPYLLHSSIASANGLFKEKKSPLATAFLEPMRYGEILESKNKIGSAFFAQKPFKANLTGHFKLMPDGVLIYQIDNPKIIEEFVKMRKNIQNGDYWHTAKIVHMTLGRLVPGQYSQKDIDAINSILDKYNKSNPFASAEFNFDDVFTFGVKTAASARDINVEKVKLTQAGQRTKEEISRELAFFDNATRWGMSGNKFEEATNVEGMLKSIADISKQGLDRYEFTFDLLLPDYYEGRILAEQTVFQRKLIPAGELYEGLKNIKEYLIENADIIKQTAKDNNVALSMHSYSLVSFAVNKDGIEVPINPHPGYNEEMKEIFGWQLEIAEALGIDNLTVHLEDFDADAYADFVKKAAGKKIKVNFENHLKHSGKMSKAADSFYYHTLIQGFISKEKFIETMLAIKSKLTEEEQEYLGVTFDTSKALNSYLNSLPVGASAGAIKAELEKVNLENLIDYYEAVENAGLSINNIHLAQFSGNVADVRERKSAEFGNALVVYNKSNVDDLSNHNLDMAAFLKYLRNKNYKGALHQETPGVVTPLKDKKASILDPLFKNKNTLWYKIYSTMLSPLWEEGVFRFLPFTLAALSAANPFVFGMSALTGIVSFSFAHIIADWIIGKERPKLNKETLKAVPAVMFTVAYLAAYFLVPYAPLISNILAFAFSSVIHGIYNYYKNKYGGRKDFSVRVFFAEKINYVKTKIQFSQAVRKNDIETLRRIIYSHVENMPQTVIRGVSGDEALAIYRKDPSTAEELGLKIIKDEKGADIVNGFGYAKYSNLLAGEFPEADIDELIKKYITGKGIDIFERNSRTTIHNSGDNIIFAEERNSEGFITDFYRTYTDNSDKTNLFQLLNSLAQKGALNLYKGRSGYLIEIYDNYSGSLIVEYKQDKSGVITVNASKIDRETKDEMMKKMKKLSKKNLAKAIKTFEGKEVVFRDLNPLTVDSLDKRIEAIMALSAEETEENFNRLLKALTDICEIRTKYFYTPEDVKAKIEYTLSSIDKLIPLGLGFHSVGKRYYNNARQNLAAVDSFETDSGVEFSDMLIYAAVLSGAKDVRGAYNNLERLYYSMPMVDPAGFLRLALDMDMDAVNINFPVIANALEKDEYSYTSPKIILFYEGFRDFLSASSSEMSSYISKLNIDIVSKSFEYLMKAGLVKQRDGEDPENLNDKYLLNLFSTFFTGTKNIKRSVFRQNAEFHNINDPYAVKKAYDDILAAAQENPKAVNLLKTLVGDELDFSLWKIQDEDFQVYADEIAQALFKYVDTARQRYDTGLINKFEAAIKDIIVFKGRGIEFKLLKRNFKEINAGDLAGDCTSPGQVNFGQYLFRWFSNPNFQSLNVYIDGKFAMKFHLVTAKSVSGDESKNGKNILVIDAMETSPIVRIEPKVLDDEAGFDPELKPLEEKFSSINYFREEAFVEGFKYIRKMASKMRVDGIYFCDMSNSVWMRDRSWMLKGDRGAYVAFENIEDYQSDRKGRVAPVAFENLIMISEIDTANNGKIKDFDMVFEEIESFVELQSTDAASFVDLLGRYFSVIHENLYSDISGIQDYAFMFLVKNAYFNKMASFLASNSGFLRNLDFSEVADDKKIKLLHSVVKTDKTFANEIPSRKTDHYKFLAELIFLSNGFVGDIKMSKSYVYDYVRAFGESFDVTLLGYDLLHTDKGEYIKSVRDTLNDDTSYDKFKKIISLTLFMYFISDYAHVQHVDLENVYIVFELARKFGIAEEDAFISENEFLALPREEKTALFYLYMLKIFERSGLVWTNKDTAGTLMMKLRGFVFDNDQAFKSLSEKKIIKFDMRERYIERIVLSPGTESEFDVFESFDKNISLFNRTVSTVISLVSAVALYVFNAPLILTGFAAYAAVNFLIQTYMVHKAGKEAKREGLIGEDEPVKAASTDGSSVKIDERVFRRLPQWYQDFVIDHEERHISLSGIKNAFLNELMTSFIDLFTLPLFMFTGSKRAKEEFSVIYYPQNTSPEQESGNVSINAGEYLSSVLSGIASLSNDREFKRLIQKLIVSDNIKSRQNIATGDVFNINMPRDYWMSRIEIKLEDVSGKEISFAVRYFSFDGSFVESAYRYELDGEKKLRRTIDERKVLATTNRFFENNNGVLSEKFSEPVIVVNNKSIAGNFYDIYNELRNLLPEENAFFRYPEFYHFAFSANRSVFPKDSQDITLSSKIDKRILKEIEGSIPDDVYNSLNDITGKLQGYFFLSSDGLIYYKVTNKELINEFNEARRLLGQSEWRVSSDMHFSLGRLFPGKNTQEDIDKVNAVLDKYNKKNRIKNIDYTFDNVLFGQFTGTGNGFVNVTRINPLTKADIAVELAYFDNATRLTEVGSRGEMSDDERFFEASGVEDMIKAIEQLPAFGISRYEFTFDVLLPDYYEGRSEKEIDAFKRKLISSDELYKGTKNIRNYLLKNAERIKQKAKENRIDISMHSFSLTSYAKDENGKDIPINPHPAFNSEMREIFDWQLEIAEALGAKNLTVHLEDNDIDGYVEFIKKAAAKKININFENHIRYSQNDRKTPDAFFFQTMIGGYMDKETFVKTMLEIQKKLSTEEQKYLGVTLDTSKALNSFLNTLPLDAGFAAINREFSKVTLENLISYYDAIVKAGLKINNIHLAQLSANFDDIKKRGPAPDDMHIVIYNKSNIDNMVNPSLDMAEFLKYLRKNGYDGALHQETNGIVVPSKVETMFKKSGGFIGKFTSPVVYRAEKDGNDPDKDTLFLFAYSGDEAREMSISGKFTDMYEHLKTVLAVLSKQNKGKDFKRVMRALINAANRKTAERIRFFEIDSAYTNDNGFEENITSEVGGFSSDRFHFKEDGLIALRADLLEDNLALFHEFIHWALAAEAIALEDIESAVTDEKIRERFLVAEPFNEKAVREKTEHELDNEDIDIEFIINSERERYNSERAHSAARAFQTQYFSGADAELTSLIRSSSEKYREGSAQENETSRREVKQGFISEIVKILENLFAKKSEEEAASAEEEIVWIEEASGEEVRSADVERKPKKKRIVKKKPVKLYDQLPVFGNAKLKNKKTLILDKNALSRLHYTPEEEVYITSLPNGDIYLSVQEEALLALADRLDKTDPLRPSYFKVFPNTMSATISATGILEIKTSKNEVNTFARVIGEEKDFILMGEEHGVVKIAGHGKHVKDILEENDITKQVLEEGVRGIEEVIRAGESAQSFTYDRMDIAFRFLNTDQKHFTPALQPVLESMIREDGLSMDQKSFALLLLIAISSAEQPDFVYVKKQIKNAGAINADALVLWLAMINNDNSAEFFAKVTDHLQGKAKVSRYSETLQNSLGSLTVLEELKSSLAISENEQWLLETERKENPGSRMLYGKYFMEAGMFEDDIDFQKLKTLKDFGVKPLALSFAVERTRNDRERLGYVNTEIAGTVVTLEVSLRMRDGIPLVLMVPLNFNASMSVAELYEKAAPEVLAVLKNDYTVKGKFAYLTGNISLLERIVNFMSNESLFRMVGKNYDFDLKAFSFDGQELNSFSSAVSELFPDSVDIKKMDAGEKLSAEDPGYYDISSNIERTKDFMTKVLKRLILKDKESESAAGIIVGEKIDSAVFSVLGGNVSPLASSGINGLSAYFEKRMMSFDSPIMLLENMVMRDSAILGDIALIDWRSVSAVQKALDAGVLTKEDLEIYGSDIENVRKKSLEISAKIVGMSDAGVKNEFDKFVEANRHLKDLSSAEQFAQYVLIGQIKDNVKKIQEKSGKIVLSVDLSDSLSKNEIVQTAVFWQSAGFDGIRLNMSGETISAGISIFSSLSAQLRSKKSDLILMAGLPLSLPDTQIKDFIEKSSELDIIAAVDVSKLSESISEYKQKIWADINPLDEGYGSDMSKYFEDIRKAVAFGAGYLGVAAGTNVVSIDGKSTHVEIMSRISEILSLNRSVTPDQAYSQGYKTGLQSKDDLKAGAETKKLIVQELILLQNAKTLRSGMQIEEEKVKRFSEFLKSEPAMIKLRFIQESLNGNKECGIYAAAGYLRGMLESSLLSEFRGENGLEDSSQSELLRNLLFLDFAMPQDLGIYSDDDLVEKMADKIGSVSPAAMLQEMLEENYGGQEAKKYTDYALYIYMLKNNGTSVSDMTKNVELLMKAHLSEINFGYGIPIAENYQSAEEKWALRQIIDILVLSEQKPAINKSVKDAVNGSVNTLAVSMMLKAA